MKKRPSQRSDETSIEFLRRVVSSLEHEYYDMLDPLPSTTAVLEYFDLMCSYGTEYWSGILECISEGQDPAPAHKFVRKFNLPARFGDSIVSAVRYYKDEVSSAPG